MPPLKLSHSYDDKRVILTLDEVIECGLH